MSAVATRRASLTPSSPGSRRGSWVDVPIVSAPSSRRGSRVDLTINTTGSTSVASPEPLSASSQTKLSIHQLLGSLSHVSDSQSRMSSPGSSRSPMTSESHTGKRKFDADADLSSPFLASSAAEIQLPSDPLRRASIINLATAAAAAVLQCQVGQRRMSTLPEQDQKRQRVEQLEMLIEQARKASDRTKSVDSNGEAENPSHNVAIANALANHLGLTPQPSAPSTPAAATPVPSSPTKAPASALAAPPTPTAPKSPLSAEPVTAERLAADAGEEKESGAAAPVQESRSDETEAKDAQRSTATAPKSATPTIVLNKGQADEPSLFDKLPAEHQREWQSTVSSDKFLDEAKEVATTYSRFYRFEKEWAQKALELERRRSSVRIDPLARLPPGNAPLSTDAPKSGPTSPKQHSAPESRIMSRGTSPFGDFSSDSAARTSHSVPSGSFSSSHRGSSSGLANVLSNFAELIEHRQRSCSGLEALAKQAKELPVKRLSQPNPQFRTTFGEFSWSKDSQGGAKAGSQTINEADADSDASSPAQDDDPAGSGPAAAQSIKAEPSPARLQVKSEKKIKEEAANPEADGPATPRSTMSIASML
ncbi:related to Hgl1p, required for dimorphism and teliospore formation [Moesziomyces antarcticus]|uniref:Related to Hgl1p, required for dimorphism and teliospore formation n=2 Tax=Pseudozyma antarctica TaxID=84753 RepID=A0A5C3FDS5_PSEA2|nr:related to Hgl1p, required for dimorphism and teliospore formation [Moesziomyces antarcticus]